MDSKKRKLEENDDGDELDEEDFISTPDRGKN